MKDMLVDARWIGDHGIGRFAREVIGRLDEYRAVPAWIPLLGAIESLMLSCFIWRMRPILYFTPGFNAPLFDLAPTVLVIHDLIHLNVAEESSRTKRFYYTVVVKRAVRFARKVVTVSEYSKRQIVAWSGVPEDRVTVVGNGVSGHFSPQGPRHSLGFPYLFYIGNRKPHKNVWRLLEAFALADIDPEIRLLLSGCENPEWMREICALGLKDRVVFTGHIPDNDLPMYYRGAVALVFPTLYEGFGLPVIEAMSCGTPVLTSNVTSLPEVAGNAAYYCEPYDVGSIATGIARIVNDKVLRTRLREAGLSRAQLYSWDAVATKVKGVLMDVMTTSKSERH